MLVKLLLLSNKNSPVESKSKAMSEEERIEAESVDGMESSGADDPVCEEAIVGSDDEGDDNKGKADSPPNMQSMEIDMGGDDTAENGMEDYADDDDDSDSEAEMNELLGSSNSPKGNNSKETQVRGSACPFPKPKKVGNMYIILPERFERTSWGLAGPHWFGPVCVIMLLCVASSYFVSIEKVWKGVICVEIEEKRKNLTIFSSDQIRISISHDGPITTTICVIFTIITACNLFNTAYRDPGVVKLQKTSTNPGDDEENRLQFRWCDFCAVYQPPDGAHCPSCNVCVAGFDHHCVWMGA